MLHLFGGPIVTRGPRNLMVPEGGKRLLVFVALHRGGVDRRYAAGALWPTVDESRAAGNLRSALWRLKNAGLTLLKADKSNLSLAADILLDLHVVDAWATRVMEGCADKADLAITPWPISALDLLPGWYDDWALTERERIRQRVLHALEVLSRLLAQEGRCAEAVEVALMAVSAEPLRESGQRALIEAHLAEGNPVEALRQYQAYRDRLRREVGAEPGRELAVLAHGVRPDPRSGRGRTPTLVT